ncbi:MAG: HAD family hydrolase, partial [archaeon]
VPPHSARPYWLVLDVHGVLIPSSEKWILNQAAKDTHSSLLGLYFRWFRSLYAVQTGSLSGRSFYERVFQRKLSASEFNRLIMSRYARRGVIDPRIFGELKRLKANGWKLAILSDMNSAQAEYHRAKKHFALFDEVSLSCETGLMKPFPDAFVSLQKRVKARPDHIVFADDLWFNSWAASLHGWKAVTVFLRRGQLLRFLRDLH